MPKGLRGFQKGNKAFLGKHHSFEFRKRLSEMLKGKKLSKGKKRTEETKRKISLARMGKPTILGRKLSEETKNKIRKAHLGKIISEETRKKISEKSKLKIREKAPNWKGGISFEIYPSYWTNTLKISIRKRDKYTCQLCGKKQKSTTHNVHHIDYNKQNCHSKNLITLCRSCNVKVNCERDYWKLYFNSLINKTYEQSNFIISQK